jgi:regulator of nonsense transcripts 2
MINQRQVAKEEQQRIKNLVLNYDLRENEEQDGEEHTNSYKSDINIHHISAGNEKAPAHHHHNRLDPRLGKDRGQRVRKLQLSDVDWYDNPGTNPLHERGQVPYAAQGHPKGLNQGFRRRNIWQPPVRHMAVKQEEHD